MAILGLPIPSWMQKGVDAITGNSMSTGLIPRNRLFRAREVTLTLQRKAGSEWKTYWSGGDPTKADPNASVRLSEVQSISQTIDGNVGVTKGVTTPIIQMWYFGPVSMEISGRSYMGAFDDDAYNKSLSRDNDIDGLYNIAKFINQAFLKTGDVRDLRIKLTYGMLSSSDSPEIKQTVSQTLVGAIGNLTFNDPETSPYLKPYIIRFTGNFEYSNGVGAGASLAKQAKDLLKKTIAGFGKGMTKLLKQPFLERKADGSEWAFGKMVKPPK